MSQKFSLEQLQALGIDTRALARVADSAKMRTIRGGFINARGIAARMGITEGGANGHLTRARLQERTRDGYIVTEHGREFGGKDLPSGPVWKATKVIPHLVALRDAGHFGNKK